MRRAFWAVLVSAMILGSLALPTRALSAWQVGTPIVAYTTFYNNIDAIDPTTLTPAIAQQAVAGGFNLVTINDVSQLAIAEQYGLRAQLVISGHQPQNNLFFLPATNWPALANVPAINALINAFKASPAAYDYNIIDEPGASRFPQLASIVSYIRARDPNHLSYINLFPSHEIQTDLETNNYGEYLDQYVNTMHPSLLSYDHYSFFDNRDESTYLQNLQLVAAKAKQAGIPFMNVVQGMSLGVGSRVPTANELRFLNYTTLAYGAQGISYFNYRAGPNNGGIEPNSDGTPTSVFTALTPLNHEFVEVATQLQSLEWIGTYLKGYSTTGSGYQGPRDTATLPGDAPFDISSVLNNRTYVDGAPLKGVMFGFFGPDGSSVGDAAFALVTNLDYTTSKTYRVNGPGLLSIFDANTGDWTATGQNYADLTLAPGGGILVGLTSMIFALGDVNHDGFVNIFDINLVSSNWGTPGPAGDSNQDGIVNIFDINLISSKWTPAPGGAAAVPEPVSAVLLVVGAALLAVNRRRLEDETAWGARKHDRLPLDDCG